MLSNGAGLIAWSAAYAPFGVVEETGALAFNLRFPGQYHDRETGLHYNYFRTYDPASGRYLESDPIGLSGGWNTYAYVGGSPLMRVDLSGLEARGQWIGNSPTIGNFDYAVHDWYFYFPPTFDQLIPWGYVNFLRILAEGKGTVYVDVRCLVEDCAPREWERHFDIPVSTGVRKFEYGINAWAIAAGAACGWQCSAAANVTIITAKFAYTAYQLYDKYYEIAMYLRAYLLAYGPSAICNKGLPPLPELSF